MCVIVGFLTSREKDLILVKKDFFVWYRMSSSASSPSIIAQLSAVGSSHSLPPELIISLEYLYCSLHTENDRIYYLSNQITFSGFLFSSFLAFYLIIFIFFQRGYKSYLRVFFQKQQLTLMSSTAAMLPVETPNLSQKSRVTQALTFCAGNDSPPKHCNGCCHTQVVL